VRDRALVWVAAVLTGAVLLVAGSADVFWNGDFIDEAWPAYVGLQREGWDAFLERLPGYSGFVILIGAPVALLGEALRWHDTEIFRATALPGLVVLTFLGVHLGNHARAQAARGWPLAVALGAGGPLAYLALLYGHPEDLLAAGAAVAAVLAALRGRPTAAAALLLVAVLAKQWAVLAILPAAMATDRGRIRILLVAGGGAAAVVAFQLLTFSAAGTMVHTGGLFHPQQIWWPLGIDAPQAFTDAGHGELTAPAWLQPLTRPILMGAAAILSIAWWLRAGRRTAGRVDALALLALVFALRCALDPWNLVYYHLPLALALLAWEVRRGEPYPVLTLAVTALAWLSFMTYDARTGMGPFLLYFAWMGPLVVHLTLHLLRAPRPRRAALAVTA